MAISKKAQEKIDALVKGDNTTLDSIDVTLVTEEEAPDEFYPEGEQAHEEVSIDDIIETSDPGHNKVVDVEIESIDTVLEEELIFENLTAGRYREAGILYKNNQSISNDKPEDMLSRLVCPEITKDSIRAYILEFTPSYLYVYFNEETYDSSPIENFIVIGKAEYKAIPIVLAEVTNTIDKQSELELYQDALSYRLAEKISKLQFYQKNLKETFHQFLKGNKTVDHKELDIKVHSQFDGLK